MTKPEPDLQLNSPSYRLAALDQDFLLGDSMRGLRFQLEYEKTEEAMRHWGIASTVVVFGSARIRENGPGRQAFWYEEARRFSRLVSERGGALSLRNGMRRNVICTGGGPGIMEAANRGATDCGAPSIGLNITLPHEQVPNAYSTPELTFQFHYFAMRKMHFAMRASALIAFPGGFGTFDELFEVMTLVQTHKMQPIPIILFDKDYWHSIIGFERLVEAGMVSADDLTLFHIVDTAEDAWAVISQHRSQE